MIRRRCQVEFIANESEKNQDGDALISYKILVQV